MVTRNDNINPNINEESSYVFHHRIQEEAGRNMARVLKCVDDVNQLKMQALDVEAETAMLFHHELFCYIEDLKMCGQTDVLENVLCDREESLQQRDTQEASPQDIHTKEDSKA